MKPILATAVLIIVASSTAATQAPKPLVAPTIDAKTPADCTTQLNDWRGAQVAPYIATIQSATTDSARTAALLKYQAAYNGATAEAVRSARQCGAKFDLDHITSAQLIEMVNFYTLVGDTANRRRATERALSATDLPPRQHGEALLLVLRQEITQAGNHFGVLDGAERVAHQVDALPDSLTDIKMSAHQSLLSRYEYLDVNEGLLQHATTLLDLGRSYLAKNRGTATPKTVSQIQGSMLSAYESLARSAADRLQPDSALMILDRGENELGKEKAAPRFADFRHRYALLGTKAPPIGGMWWINAASSSPPVNPGDGTVRVIEFTAHWCIPCRNSYPGLLSLGERFTGQPFEEVLATSLYGYLGDKRNLTPEQEVEADRAFFTKEHALPFRMAINASPNRAQPQIELDYRVGGIPQIIIIDRRGVIRQIVTGWDQGNTKRIGDLVERLLKEPTHEPAEGSRVDGMTLPPGLFSAATWTTAPHWAKK